MNKDDRPWFILLAGFVLASLFWISWGLTVLGVLLIILALAWKFEIWYWFGEKCPACRRGGTIREVSRQIVAQQRGFGITTRTEKHTGYVGRQPTSTTVQRQERVPTVTSTVQVNYVCRVCRKPAYKQYVTQQEDFSPTTTAPTTFVREVHREILKVPCKYCGTLLDPVRQQHCASCGAKVSV